MFGFLLALPGLADRLLSYLAKRQEGGTLLEQARIGADQAVNVAALQAEIERQRILAATRAADRGHWATAWMVPAAFAVSLLHYAAVVADTVGLFAPVGAWRIPALPAPYDAMQREIILATAGIYGTAKVLGRVFGGR